MAQVGISDGVAVAQVGISDGVAVAQVGISDGVAGVVGQVAEDCGTTTPVKVHKVGLYC